MNNTNNNSDTPDDDNTNNDSQEEQQRQTQEMLEGLDSELSFVERALEGPRQRLGGRVGFNSVADSLRSIRARLSRLNSGTLAGSLRSAMSRRLDAADVANSSHIPLEVVRQRSERVGRSTTTASQIMESGARAEAAAAAAAAVASKEEEEEEEDGAEMDYGQDGGSQDKDELSGTQRRRPSLLVASRTRSSMAEDFPQSHHRDAASIAGGTQQQPLSERKLSALQEGEGIEEEEEYDLERPSALPATEIPVLLTKTQSQRIIRSTSNSSLSGSVLVPPIPDAASQQQGPGSIIYSWGSGFQSLHDDDTDRESPVKLSSESRLGRPGASAVVSVATSVTHTAVATSQGSVLTCGDNVDGAVDPCTERAGEKESSKRIPRPTLLESINTRVLQVSCGYDHTAALTENGAVLTWGSNRHGQLGHRKSTTTANGNVIPTTYCRPQSLLLTGGSRAAAVACGHYFTLVLTTRMNVLVCGIEAMTGRNEDEMPATLPALQGLPLSAVSAGHHHAVVLTSNGTALAWGRNLSGCCGRPYPEQLSIPVEMHVPATDQTAPKSSRPSLFANWERWGLHEDASLADDVAIVHAACGERHTVLVTRSGRLLVCGSNREGQIGRMEEDQVSPLVPLDHPEVGRGCKFLTVECGTSHTLLLDSEGSVWQMGGGCTTGMQCVLAGKQVLTLAAGGSQSIAVAAPGAGSLRRQFSITAESVTIVEGGLLPDNLDELLEQEGSAAEIAKRTEELLQNPAVLNSLFFDPSELYHMYPKLAFTGTAVEQQTIAKAIEKGITKGLKVIEPDRARLIYPESVRCLLLYLKFFDRPSESEIVFDTGGLVITSLCEAILGLPFEGYKAFLRWATSLYTRELYVNMLVKPLLSQLDKSLRVTQDSDGVIHVSVAHRAVPSIVSVLGWLYSASERMGDIAKPEDFYSESMANIPIEALYDDLRGYKKASKTRVSTFHLCASPFLFPPSTKRNLLRVENQVEMFKVAATDGITFDVEHAEFSIDPFWKLEIERERMLEQTFAIIKKTKPSDLRKRLMVKFKGEEGVDAGGVTKEFFQLLSEELFDINTGMWTDRFGSDITWFNSDCNWDDIGFELTGVLVGLALYNSVLLDVRFPTAVYRKLLGLPLGLEDMVDLDLKKGFQQLLDYEGDDVELVFCLNFEVTWVDDLGEEKKYELVPGGSEIAVTSKNKEEYVRLYVKWLLVDSIYPQWDSFERGVMRVMEGSSLHLFRPEEMELLVVGSPELDFDALEANTQYEGGYDSNSDVVRNFWRFIESADRESQIQFLKFATGSSKAPIGGLGELGFKIQRAGPDSPQLPTSHTCFSTLLLPDYGSDYDKLAERLGRAIVECEGFGLQ